MECQCQWPVSGSGVPLTHHPNRAGMRTAAALSNRTVSFCGLLRKTHTQVTEFPHMRLSPTSLILI